MVDEIADLDQRHVWHPFTQMRDWCGETPLVIKSAEGTDLQDVDGRRYIDGVSSLWCNVHGHRHPLIDRAVRDQLGGARVCQPEHRRMCDALELVAHRLVDEGVTMAMDVAPQG